MLDNCLNTVPHRINNKDVLKGINYLSSLYEYCKDEQLNIISMDILIHQNLIRRIEVDIGPIAYHVENTFYFGLYFLIHLVRRM